MKDFIMKLFENEYFPIYLGIIIFILIVAFLVIFFLGRKDKKKIEKTQKLETVTDNTFKEVSNPVALEAPLVENTPAISPVASEVPVMENSPVISPQMPISEPVVSAPAAEMPINNTEPVIEPIPMIQPVVEQPPITDAPAMNVPLSSIPEPILESDSYQSTPIVQTPIIEPPVVSPVPEPPVVEPPIVNTEPIIETNLENFDNLASSIANELEQLEKQQQVSMPVVENPLPEEPAPMPSQNSTTVVNDVFSSVYVPKREETVIDDTMAIELPKLKEEPILTENSNDELKL